MFYRFLAVFLFVIPVSFAGTTVQSLCKERQCSVIIDAGSSGTRAHLYAFDVDENDHPTHIDELFTQKITPGFSSVEPTAEQVGQYMARIMTQIPEQNVPVYFYATAGMRLLSMEQQQTLYSLLEQWFSQNPQWKLQEARTISGSEEGVFGWLSTNYQLGLFNDNQPLASFIEIGGASTQVAFPIEQTNNVSDQDVVNLTINNRQIHLFAHSFLGLGANEVTKKFQNIPACFPSGYTMPDSNIAQGDSRLCQDEVAKVINQDYAITDIIKAAKTNNPTSLWYTVGAASYLVKKISDTFPNDQFTAEALLDKVNITYCQPDWSEQQQKYNNDPNAYQNCLIGAFYYGLTISNYGLQPDQTINLLPPNIQGDWTLGAILQQSYTTNYH